MNQRKQRVQYTCQKSAETILTRSDPIGEIVQFENAEKNSLYRLEPTLLYTLVSYRQCLLTKNLLRKALSDTDQSIFWREVYLASECLLLQNREETRGVDLIEDISCIRFSQISISFCISTAFSLIFKHEIWNCWLRRKTKTILFSITRPLTITINCSVIKVLYSNVQSTNVRFFCYNWIVVVITALW